MLPMHVHLALIHGWWPRRRRWGQGMKTIQRCEDHYDADLQLYRMFEEKTGIRINRIDGRPDQLMARMQTEGSTSPADMLRRRLSEAQSSSRSPSSGRGAQ